MSPDPLAGLRPVHTPPPPGWWPPAPGWWLLAGALLLAAAGTVWWWRRRTRLRRAALRELDALAARRPPLPELAEALNRLLKRYALACYPRHQVAALTGQRWLAFLDAHGGHGRFRHGPGRALLALAYGAAAPSPQPLSPERGRGATAPAPTNTPAADQPPLPPPRGERAGVRGEGSEPPSRPDGASPQPEPQHGAPAAPATTPQPTPEALIALVRDWLRAQRGGCR